MPSGSPKHLDVDLHPIVVEPDIVLHLERMLYYLDEPQADPAPINALLIAEQAKRDGYKVLLSGAGGDDIFSGYRRHWALRMERMWGWLPHPVRRGMAATANGSRLAGILPLPRRLRRALAYADLPSEDRLISYFFWTSDRVRTSLYHCRLQQYAGGRGIQQGPSGKSLARIPDERDPLNRCSTWKVGTSWRTTTSTTQTKWEWLPV